METTVEVQDFDQYVDGNVGFDNLSDSRHKTIDPFLKEGSIMSKCFFSNSNFFWLDKKNYRKKSSTMILFNNALKYVDVFYRRIAGLDLSYDGFKDLCRETRRVEEYKDLYVDQSKTGVNEKAMIVRKGSQKITQIVYRKQNLFCFTYILTKIFKKN